MRTRSGRRPGAQPRRRFAPALWGAVLEGRVVPSAVTATALTSSANPAPYNAGATLTATVTAAAGTPTGAVTFYDGANPLGTVTLDASGQAQLVEGQFLPGPHTVTASYGGDAGDDPSTSAPLTQVVNPAPTTTQVSNSPEATTYGLPVLLSASVDNFLLQSPAPPTGTITFYFGTTPLGTGTLNGQGGATFTTSTLPAGADQITASYSGDASNAPSTSAPMTLTVSPAATSVALTVPKGPVSPGQSVVFTAFVTPNPAGTQAPTGPVVFYDGATTVLGKATVSGNLATLTLAGLSPGSHSITAVYPGDGNFTTNTSAPAQVVVTGSSTSTSPNSSFLNQVYLDLLHRPVDSGALAVWSSLLNAGQSRTSVVLAIESSREYALTTLSDLSRSLVGVASTSSMQSQALALLAKGQASSTALEAVVLNSPEFYVDRAGRNNAKFVSAVSVAVTGLPPDPSRVAGLLALANRGNRPAVVTSILTSPAGLSAFVNNAFVRYLGHAGTPSAVQPYTAELARGVSSSVVIAQILSS